MEWGAVLAALVTAVGGIITTLILAFRKENRSDHADVMEAVQTIGGNVQVIDNKLSQHIQSHSEGTNGRPVKRNPRTKINSSK